MNQLSFRAMGCKVIVGGATRAAFDEIQALFRSREATFTRFRDGSELNRVNAARAPLLTVSPVFAAAVSAALDAARSTLGLVDPTLGAAIVATGYDVDFCAIVPDSRPSPSVPRSDWRRIRIGHNLLFRPAGTVLDLNGVVKAMTVDEAVAVLDGAGFVSAGGDIATTTSGVTVGLPGGGAVALESGGIATSGSATRRWLRGGSIQHHLLDPRSGRPSTSPWVQVTAIGRDCLSADVAAKAGFLLGDDGPAWLEERRVAARFVGPHTTVENSCWQQSLEGVSTWV